MVISDVIIVAIITGCFMLANTYLSKEHKSKRSRISKLDKSLYYIELDKICFNIRSALKCDGVYIAYFHNGGNFINGISMDKYSVVGEDYSPNLNSYKAIYRDKLVNNFPYLFHNLIVANRHCITSTKDYSFHDKMYRDELNNRNVNSAYTYLIKDPVKKTPLGFVSLEYIQKVTLNETDERFIWKYQNDIANILNMGK